MMATKAESCPKMTASLEFSTLHSMSRGMKTRRDSTAAGNRALSFEGCAKKKKKIHQRVGTGAETGRSSRLTHWTRDGAPRPARSMMLNTMKQQTQVNTLSARDTEH